MDLGWLWVVPILGVLIVVHELGHFISALRLGIKVEEFGIGFPPRLFAVRRNGIDYSINWLPIGGFVKITGENGDSDDPKSFGKAPAWKRIIVLAAGSFMNLVLAIFIFALMAVTGTQEVDTSIAPYTGVQSVLDNSPALRAGLQPGDRIVAIGGQPVQTEVDIKRLSGENAGKPTAFTIERSGQDIQVTLTPNTTSPYLGVGLVPWVSPAKVDDVRTGGVAAVAGLKNGDIIAEVNGEKVNNSARASHLISQSKEPIKLVVERDGKQAGPFTIAPSPNSSYEFTLYRPYRTVYYGPLDAVGRALGNTWGVVAAIPAGIAQAIAGQADGPGVTSIVGIGQLTGEVAQDAGINGLLNLTALLSISLFMINLLPLPALDGGRLLFIFIELLRGGRRIAPEKEGMVHFAGMVVLLAIMALITFFDVSRLLQGVRLLP
jgi:regulator of sigma E protease